MWNENNLEDNQLSGNYDVNPYESFMRRHLQHYGYYTGRNEGYRHSLPSFEDWEKTHAYDVTDSESDSDDANDKDDKDKGSPDDYFRTTQLVYNFQAGRMVPRLREPRQLYAMAKDMGPQQAARWPSDIQVMKHRVKHIEYVPNEREPFYKRTCVEKMPLVKTEEGGGRVVYNYEPTSGPFFIRSRVGGYRGGCSDAAVKLNSEEDTTLIFESRFESANLAKAVQVDEYDYELTLRNDLYTKKHTQWFYFRVTNTRANVKYRFNIVNFMKSDSLYNNGMKPLMYSERRAMDGKIGWTRSGSDIKYYRNNLKYSTTKGERSYYSLSWTMQLPYDSDTVYIAHCFPYTYTDLQDYILDIMNDPVKSKICKQRVLCRSLAGNLVYVLTITSPSKNIEDGKHKKAIVLTARVHPGETQASWMMKGFLDYLTGNSADAKVLRDTFIFKIVPMLNPDGVIVGNYRCSLSGRDLNRNYKTVLKESFPSVWHTKNMIRKLLEEREVIVYCDMHGHSRKHNVFIYGCENRKNCDQRLHERVFPVMLHKNSPEKFVYDYCKFKVQKSKEGTGRVVIWNMGIMNSYTMEATFAGSEFGNLKGYHFTSADFELMGFHFCDTLLDYCDPDKTKCTNVLLELEEKLRKEIVEKLEKQGQDVTLEDVHLSDDYGSEVESSDSGGSDSSVSDGLPVHLQYMNDQVAKKKKKLKSKKERDSQRNAQKDDKPKLPPHSQCKHPTTSPTALKPHMRFSNNSGKRSRSKNGADASTNPTYVVNNPQDLLKPTDDPKQSRHSAPSKIVSFNLKYSDIACTRVSYQKEYLEALTNALLKSGVMMPTDAPTDVPHFRYSLATKTTSSTFPVNLDNLCPIHAEQTLAAQFVSQLQELQDRNDNDIRDDSFSVTVTEDANSRAGPVRYKLITRRAGAAANRAASQSLSVQPSNRVMLEHAVAKQQQYPDAMDIVYKKESNKVKLKPLKESLNEHVVDSDLSSEMDPRYCGDDDDGGGSSPLKQHPPPFDQLLEREKSHDYVKVSREKSSTQFHRPRVPSATATYISTPTAQVGSEIGDQFNDNRGERNHLENANPAGSYGSDAASHNGSSIRQQQRGVTPKESARKSREITSTIDSIQKLRASVISSAKRANLSPTTGECIEQIVKMTGDEVNSITAEIEDTIEKKKLDSLSKGATTTKQTEARWSKSEAYNDSSDKSKPVVANVKPGIHKETPIHLNRNSPFGQQHAASPSSPFSNSDNDNNGNNSDRVLFSRAESARRGKATTATRLREDHTTRRSRAVRSNSVGPFINEQIELIKLEEGSRRGSLGSNTYRDVSSTSWDNRSGNVSEGDRKARIRSGKGSKGVQEVTSPTKISLMISDKHHHPAHEHHSMFYPTSRSHRPPLLRMAPSTTTTNQSKK
ncbi:uncharacterized protein LOC141912655 [Tubulanus polymorphus]|uniref:uncharacterized protein LOC141912655 n=1 Tax=Tubulanus polymorphus TaxID=672921 RepID=UPI003DA2226A